MASNITKSKEFIDTSDDDSDREQKRVFKKKKESFSNVESDIDSELDQGPEAKIFKEDIDLENIPYASLSKAPRKKSSQFKVTIMPRLYTNELTRNDFFETLVDLYKNIEVIVSMEDNPNYLLSKYRSKKYFKIFLDFSSSKPSKLSSKRVYSIFHSILRDIVGEESKILEDLKKISDYDRKPEIIIESVTHKKRAISWATNDYFPRFTENFEPSEEFSESFRLHNWAFINKDNKYAMETTFVTDSRISTSKLKAFLDEVRNKYHVKHELKICELGPFNDWRDQVINWWNSWIKDGWYHKKPQLLLISPPNCGKTVFIKEVLFKEGQEDEIPMDSILIPERAGSGYYVSQFAWSKANPNIHVVVFCDEYELKHYNTELLKIILQGGSFPLAQKYKPTVEDINLRMPMIFATNHRLPKAEEAAGLEERFLIIEIPKNLQFNRMDTSPYKHLFKELERKKKEQISNGKKFIGNVELKELFENSEFQDSFLKCSQDEFIDQRGSSKKDFYKTLGGVCSSLDSISLSQVEDGKKN